MFRTNELDGNGSPRSLIRRAANAAAIGIEPLEMRLLLSSTPHGEMLAGPIEGYYEPDQPPLGEFVLGPKWNQPGGLGSQLLLTWSYSNLLNGALGGGLTTAQLQAAMIEALQVWSAVVPLRFEQRVDSGPLPTAGHTQYTEGTSPRLRFGHHAIDGAGSVLAHAFYPDPTTGSTVGGLQGDTHFDTGETWRLTPGAGGFDIIEVAVHELGHALGLDHEPMPPTGNNAIMNPFYGGRYSGPGTAFLLQDDINGIRALYGNGLGYVLDLSGRLYVSGTEAANAITVSYSGTNLTISSTGSGSFTRPISGVSSIEINGRGGDDTFYIDSLPSNVPLTINGGAGNDRVHVSWIPENLDTINSTITFNGGTGTDSIVLWDNQNTFSDTYTITSSNISRTAWSGISYSNVATISLYGSSGNNPFNVNSTASGVTYLLEGRGGNDTFNIGNGDLDWLSGAVTVFGGDGTDSIVINDTTNTWGDTFTITSTTVNRDAWGGGLSYTSTTEGLTINAGSGNSAFNVNSTASTTPVTINAGGGNDTLNLGTGNLDTIAGAVAFSGQAGTDTIVVNDSSGTTARTYTVTSTQVTRPGFAGLTYGTSAALTLNAAGGNDAIYVNSTLAATPVTINGGGGNDTGHLGWSGGNLSVLAGAVTFNGGTGTDTVSLWDDLQSTSRSYTITSNQATGSGFGGLTYSGLTGLFVNGGSGNDWFNVDSALAATPVTINAGAGDDTLHLSYWPENLNTVAGAVTFNGGAGSDSIVLWDNQNTGSDTYTITSTAVTRPNFGGLTYSNATSLRLLGQAGNNTFNINSTLATTPVTIEAGTGNDHTVLAFPTGNLNSIAGAVTVNGGAGNDTVTLWDDLSATGRGYSITSTQVTGGFGGLTYSGLTGLFVNGGGGNDWFDVGSALAATPVTINAGAGDDELHLSYWPENLNTVAGAVTFNGGAGSDSIVFWDNQNTGSDTYTITSTAITRPSFGGLTYSNTASILLFGQTGNNTFNVNSTHPSTALTLYGLNGNDQFNINAPPSSTINVHGGDPTASPGDGLLVVGTPASTGVYTPSAVTPGSGQVVVNGQNINFTGIDTPSNAVEARNFGTFRFVTPNSVDSIEVQSLILDGKNIISGTSGGVAFARLLFRDIQNFILDTGANDAAGGGSGNDSVRIAPNGLVAAGLATFRFIGGVGNDTLTVDDGIFTFTNDPSIDTANLHLRVNTDGAGTATVRFMAPISRISSLTLHTGGNVVLPTGTQKVLATDLITMIGSGRIDLNTNGLIVHPSGSPVAQNVVHNWLAMGYNSGAWTGDGITSSSAAATPGRAVGMGLASALGISTFMGVPIMPNTVVLRYTYAGDANLDQQVNIADLGILAANWQATGRYWYQGNFNYDSAVNIADLGILAANWQAGVSFSESSVTAEEEEEVDAILTVVLDDVDPEQRNGIRTKMGAGPSAKGAAASQGKAGGKGR
jgi:hypothetical protein